MFQDLRFGVRMLLKNKGFTTVAILSLGLGIATGCLSATVLSIEAYELMTGTRPFACSTTISARRRRSSSERRSPWVKSKRSLSGPT